MAKNQEESWVENGLIDNLRLRWIIRKENSGSWVFVAQLEYTNKPEGNNTIIRWDGGHDKYHRDIYNTAGNKTRRQDCGAGLPSITKQIDIVFEDLTENLLKILDNRFHSDLLDHIAGATKSFQDRLVAIRKNITEQWKNNRCIKLGTRHWGQNIEAGATIVKIKDSLDIKLYDSRGNLKEKRKVSCI